MGAKAPELCLIVKLFFTKKRIAFTEHTTKWQKLLEGKA